MACSECGALSHNARFHYNKGFAQKIIEASDRDALIEKRRKRWAKDRERERARETIRIQQIGRRDEIDDLKDRVCEIEGEIYMNKKEIVDPILDALERAPRGELTADEVKALADARAETPTSLKSHEQVIAALNAARPDRKAEFRDFCCMMLGTKPEAPLADANGATVSALVSAFSDLDPIEKKKDQHQTFDGPVWLQTMVYIIINTVTGWKYVGRARDGFLKRYPHGEWWKHHHNDPLNEDLLVYGKINFHVSAYPCHNEEEMKQTEAMLIRANRSCMYNLKLEPDE